MYTNSNRLTSIEIEREIEKSHGLIGDLVNLAELKSTS